MHHLVARHIRAVAVVIDEFDNFPHAAEYLRSKSESEGNLENDLTAAAGDEMRPRDHKIRDLKYRSQYPPVCVFLVYNPVILNSNDNLK